MTQLPLSKSYQYKPLVKYEGLLGKTPIRAGTTFVGIEIELEQIQKELNLTGSIWKVTEDGSLKDKGREFVTVPIQFQFLEIELQRLFTGIGKHKVSSRCSVHVHLNVRDMTPIEIYKLTLLYLIFERSLYRYSGDRWNSNYCVPLYLYTDVVKKALLYLEEGVIYETWYKYFGFNLSPIFGGESDKIGTIEFRQMTGTIDISWIINWINLIVSLKITAKKLTTEELQNHIKTMNTSSCYTQLAKFTFNHFSDLIVNQPTFKEDVESCITKVKSICIPKTVNKQEVIIPIGMI